jgi:putative transposon-encoded protein
LQRGTYKDIGPKGIFERASKVFRQFEENMVVLKREAGLKEISRKPADPGKSPKPKFRVLGEEMIEKEVKPSGNSGRVYLPLNWVGKHVKIIRIRFAKNTAD